MRAIWQWLRRPLHRLLRWWLGFRWIAVAVGVPLIGIALSENYWEVYCFSLDSLCMYASDVGLVIGVIIMFPLIMRAKRWEGFWWIAGTGVLLATGIGLSWLFWEELHDERETVSTTIRNLSLVVGGCIAIELSVWRSVVGERQTAVAQQQSETAQRDLLNQQFQKGTEMLGSGILSVRLGGIYALRHLAFEHPQQYHIQVMEQLCAFIKGTTSTGEQPTASLVGTQVFLPEELLALFPDRENLPEELTEGTIERYVARGDIQEAMNAVAVCHDKNLETEKAENYWLDLRGADLRGADLSVKNLSGVPMNFSKLVSPYQLWPGRYTNMRGVKLDDASLLSAKLTRVDLSYATGLTQEELNGAMADPESKPKLEGVFDARTGKPIVWKDDSSQNE